MITTLFLHYGGPEVLVYEEARARNRTLVKGWSEETLNRPIERNSMSRSISFVPDVFCPGNSKSTTRDSPGRPLQRTRHLWGLWRRQAELVRNGHKGATFYA
jgi:hypothetical protein